MFWSYLRSLRQRAGFSVRDLAAKIEWSHSMIATWETGDSRMYVDQLDAYLVAVGATEAERAEALRLAGGRNGVPVLAADSDGCLTPSGSAGGDGGTPPEDEAQPAPAAVSCGRCGGAGQVAGDDCGACESTGRVVAA